MRLEVLTTIPALLCALALSFNAVCDAQNTDAGKAAPLAAMAPTAVPALVPYSGTAMSLDGKQLTGEVAITFLIFKEVQGGEPLWVETQTVSLDATGHYLVQLGASSPAGLPTTTFASGEGRWLEAQIAGQEPRPRVLLSSVPYAMKAADAETLGGVPAAEFVTRAQLAQAARDLTAQASPLVTPFATTTGSGTTNYIPLWTSSSALGNSLLYQAGSNVEFGTSAAPAGLLAFGNVSNSSNGSFPTYTATAYNSVGYEGPRVLYNRYEGTQSAPAAVKSNDTLGWMDFYGYDGTSLQRAGLFAVFADAAPTAGIVPGRFQMNTANSAGIDTARLTLYSNDNVVMAQHGGKVGIGTSAVPAATLEVNGTAKFDGNITFASTQTFPVKSTAGGTVTSVMAGNGLTGGPITTTGALSVDATKVPLLATENIFAGTQTISSGSLLVNAGDIYLPATTAASVGNLEIGGAPILHNCCVNSIGNTFVGINSGSYTANVYGSNGGNGYNTAEGSGTLVGLAAGYNDTAVGATALGAVVDGRDNTGIGAAALSSMKEQYENTAVGSGALQFNVNDNDSTAVGFHAGNPPSGTTASGSLNTFIGAYSGPVNGNNIEESTAIGQSAQVGESFALVLGGTGANAVSVGIGTTTPSTYYPLDVEGTVNTLNGGIFINSQGGNIILGENNGSREFRVDISGNVHIAGAYETGGADFAESMAVHGSKSGYEAGDLLVIDRGAERSLALSRRPYSTLVAGIYSTKPGVLGSPHEMDDPQIDKEVPLAVVGIVPCKVTAQNGPIREGDLLVTSSRPGYAMKGIDRRRMLGAVVGKALQPLAKGDGVIQVLVTLQ